MLSPPAPHGLAPTTQQTQPITEPLQLAREDASAPPEVIKFI
jgi:hypothetical protein